MSKSLFGEIRKTKNGQSYSKYRKIYEKKFLNSFKDFANCTSDLTDNPGIRLIERSLQGFVGKDFKLSFEEYICNENIRNIISSYIDDIQHYQASSNIAPPILILEGPRGYGKESLAKCLSKELKTQLGFWGQCESSLNTIVIFENFKTMLEEIEEGFIGIPILICHRDKGNNGPKSLLPVLNKIKGHYQLVVLDEGAYGSVTGNLVSYFLSKYRYKGKQLSSEYFASNGVLCSPFLLDSIIGQASESAKYSGKRFTYRFIEESIEKYRSVDIKNCDFVHIKKPSKKFEDLVISPNIEIELREAVFRINSMNKNSFEFLKKIRSSKRVVCLFSGPPGTGKSLSGEVIASETGKNLWVVDIGAAQSKWVGESEKRISDIFRLAQQANAVLLLDECDSFLSERSGGEAQQYTNKLTNHLLNLIEDYSGTLILTTNLGSILDEAVRRRIDINLEFKMPSEREKQFILKTLLLPDAPISKDFSFEQSVKGLALSGGLIRTAVEKVGYQILNSPQKITTELMRMALEAVAPNPQKVMGIHLSR